MVSRTINVCQCPPCQDNAEHPDRVLHQRMNLFMSRLDEQQRRWYAALESWQLGRGGVRRVSQITGLSEKTIRRGRKELATLLAERPLTRVRQPGGGRRKAIEANLDDPPAHQAASSEPP